jgi:hypothetical protein
MKSLMTFLFLFLGFYSFGQTKDIVVFSESGEDFTLFVNSVKQNQEPRANVKAKDLRGESFVLRVEFKNPSIPVITSKVWNENNDIELTSVIRQNKKGKYVLRYMGEAPKNSDTDQYSEAEYVVYADSNVDTYKPDVTQVNTNAETVTTTTIVTEEQVAGGKRNTDKGISLTVNETGVAVSSSVGRENVNINFNINSATGIDTNIQTSENVSTTTTTTTVTSNSNPATNDNVVVENVESNYTPVNSRCPYPMSSSEFNDAIKSVKSKTFKDSQLTTAKQICKANCMTAEQVRDMNKVFDFEDTKLDFAKFAYEFVFDASKYYKVNDSFEFEMTIEELNEFLEDK